MKTIFLFNVLTILTLLHFSFVTFFLKNLIFCIKINEILESGNFIRLKNEEDICLFT